MCVSLTPLAPRSFGSQIVKDFLLTCFQKDPNLRVSAKKLMKHPWMVAARRQMTNSKEATGGTTNRQRGDSTPGEGSRRSRQSPAPASGSDSKADPAPPPLGSHDEQIQRVQEWNEKLVKTSCKRSRLGGVCRITRSLTRPARLSRCGRDLIVLGQRGWQWVSILRPAQPTFVVGVRAHALSTSPPVRSAGTGSVLDAHNVAGGRALGRDQGCVSDRGCRSPGDEQGCRSGRADA